MIERFKKGKVILQTDGFIVLIKRTFIAIIRPFFEYKTYYLYENNLDNELEYSPRIGKYHLRIISTTKEIDDLIADGFDIKSYHAGIDALKRRINKGAILFSLFIDRDLAHTTWAALTNEAKEDIDPTPYVIDYSKEVCLGDSRTNPKYQKLGIYVYVCYRAYQYLRETGVQKAKFAILSDNIAPQKGQKKLRSIIYGKLQYLKLFKRNFYKEIYKK